MLVLFLFTSASALNLTQFKYFKIDIDAKSKEYFMFQGEDYMYFYQKNGQFELWVTQNDSYTIYTSPYVDHLTFEWPDKLINSEPMNISLNEGDIIYPLKFDSEVIFAYVYGVSTGSLDLNESDDVLQEDPVIDLFKCPPSNSWLINILIVGLIGLILTLLGVKHESIRTLLGPNISGIIWRIGQILPRSEEETPPSESEED